ncbi:MAG: DUF4149 domain-containing protein [Acidobacteriaceae bacterium]
MQTLLRTLKLLCLVLWLGGLLFFGAVLAPVAFSRLPSTHLAGLVVGGSLNILHFIGLGCGVVFILTTYLLYVLAPLRKPRILGQIVLVAVMLGLTAFSQFHIIPHMDRDRQQVGEIDSVPTDNPYRANFDRLHVWSERVEEGVMLCGLIVLVLVAKPEPTV